MINKFIVSFSIGNSSFIDCWKPDPHDRPRFPDILNSLESIAKSDFPRTAVDSFRSLQDKWKSEIERIFEELKEKEKEISSREEELVKIEIDQKRLEEHLKSKELELQERERVLLEREIVMAVQVETSVFHLRFSLFPGSRVFSNFRRESYV